MPRSKRNSGSFGRTQESQQPDISSLSAGQEVRLSRSPGNAQQTRSRESTLLNPAPAGGDVVQPALSTRPLADSSGSNVPTKKDISPKSVSLEVTMSQQTLPGKPSLPQNAIKKYGKIAKLQDLYLAGQTKLKSERDTIGARHGNLTESLSRFTRLSEPQEGQKAKRSSKRKKAAYEQVLADIEAVQKQMQIVTDLEQSLGKLEYRLARLLPKLLEIIGSNFKVEELVPARSESVSGSSSSRQPSSSPLQPPERAYYKKRGHVRVLRDGLYNHHSRLREAIDEHITGLSTPANDAEESQRKEQLKHLRAKWEYEHSAMEEKLEEEEQELKRLWETCQWEGLDVGDLEPDYSNDREGAAQIPLEDNLELDAPPFLPLDPSGYVPTFLKDFRWPERGAFTISGLSDLANFSSEKQDFIKDWVGQLPVGKVFGLPAEPPAPVEIEHELLTPRSDSDWMLVHRSSDDAAMRWHTRVFDEDGTAPINEPLQQNSHQRASSDGALMPPTTIRRSHRSPRASTDIRAAVDRF